MPGWNEVSRSFRVIEHDCGKTDTFRRVREIRELYNFLTFSKARRARRGSVLAQRIAIERTDGNPGIITRGCSIIIEAHKPAL